MTDIKLPTSTSQHASSSKSKNNVGRYKGVLAAISLIGLKQYKLYAVLLFVLGLTASIFELGAFTVIAIALSSIENGGTFPPALLENVSILEAYNPLPIAALFFFGFLLLSALFFYFSGLCLARLRKVTFRDFIERFTNCLLNNSHHSFVLATGQRGLSRILRRDCRYASRAVTALLSLPRPIILSLVVIGFGACYFPVVTLIGAILILLSIPLHMKVGRWGTATMDTLLSTAAAKGLQDKKIVSSITRSPYPVDDIYDDIDKIGYDHARHPDVMNFLNAYERRSILSPTSVFVSKLITFVIILTVGAYLYHSYQLGTVQLSQIVLIIFGFRLISQSLSQIAEIMTVVVSYSPLVHGFINFISGKEVDSDLPNQPYTVLGREYLPSQMVCIGNGVETALSGPQASKLWQYNDSHLVYINGDTTSRLPKISPEHLANDLAGAWIGFSTEIKVQMSDALHNPQKSTDTGRALLAFWYNQKNERSNNALLWDSKSFSGLKQDDRLLLIDMLGAQPWCIQFPSFPKRAPNIGQRPVFYLSNDEFIEITSEEDYFVCKNRSAAAGSKETREDLETFSDLDGF